MTSFLQISPTQLVRLVGTAQAPHIVDLRIEDDFATDPHLIPGAMRHDWQQIDTLAAADRPVVLICHKGLKISQGAAALLRARGVRAEILSGGMVAWRGAGYPTADTRARPATSRWVTRHRPKIDRIACPWLIRRFIDPHATFLYVAPSQVEAVAERYEAEPFDIPNARFGHHGGRCTFDAILGQMSLNHPPLNTMAEIIRAADIGQPDNVPQAAGFAAVLLGLSRVHSDDLAQVEAAMPVMDALYRWARDTQTETHEEPA